MNVWKGTYYGQVLEGKVESIQPFSLVVLREQHHHNQRIPHRKMLLDRIVRSYRSRHLYVVKRNP